MKFRGFLRAACYPRIYPTFTPELTGLAWTGVLLISQELQG